VRTPPSPGKGQPRSCGVPHENKRVRISPLSCTPPPAPHNLSPADVPVQGYLAHKKLPTPLGLP